MIVYLEKSGEVKIVKEMVRGLADTNEIEKEYEEKFINDTNKEKSTPYLILLRH